MTAQITFHCENAKPTRSFGVGVMVRPSSQLQPANTLCVQRDSMQEHTNGNLGSPMN